MTAECRVWANGEASKSDVRRPTALLVSGSGVLAHPWPLVGTVAEQRWVGRLRHRSLDVMSEDRNLVVQHYDLDHQIGVNGRGESAGGRGRTPGERITAGCSTHQTRTVRVQLTALDVVPGTHGICTGRGPTQGR
jgi:hypothetical protein